MTWVLYQSADGAATIFGWQAGRIFERMRSDPGEQLYPQRDTILAARRLKLSEKENLTPAERRRLLSQQLADMEKEGKRIVFQGDYQAIIADGTPINHVLHLMLSFFTVGLWAIIWMVDISFHKETKEFVRVDIKGNVTVTKI